MNVMVVDASALAAIMFDEPEGQEIATRLDGVKIFAPALLDFEIANVCLTKLRRYPDQRDRILQAFALRGGLSVEIAEADHNGALPLAEKFGLSGYDASYLWLADHLDAELVTLDRQLARAATLLRPG